MAEVVPSSTTAPKLVFRMLYRDGRLSTLITWPNGEWKVEIFASEAHAREFAKLNSMVIEDVREND